MRVVATAGHVDHGKSTLVHTLTGTDPDRFPEEKSRGLTIDLGFAFCTLPSGIEVGFVDVPGHTKFIKNMLAGVGAVDVAVLVVAANEGWKPQSEEHLRILDLLDVRHGIVVVTKSDLVDPETLEIAQLEVAEHIEGTTFAHLEVVTCAARSGEGLDTVRAALDRALAAAPGACDNGRPRLWIDRVFAAKGAGTVVTGTLTGGTLHVDDEIQAGDHPVRIRAIESHGRASDIGEPGARVALNLVGVDRSDLTRGDAIVGPEQWHFVTTVDVALTLMPGTELRTRGRLTAAVGSGEHRVWFRQLGGSFARIRFADPLPLAPGDRIVLRDSGSRQTVGGAEVLDLAPARKAPDAVARLEQPLADRVLAGGWVRRGGLDASTGLAPDTATAMLIGAGAEPLGDWLVRSETIAAARRQVLESVLSHHQAHPESAGLPLADLGRSAGLDPDRLEPLLATDSSLVVEQGLVRHRDHAGRASTSAAGIALIAELDASPFAPAPPADPSLRRALVREGVLTEIDGITFTTAAIDAARMLVIDALRERGSITIADARDVLGSTRKFVVPIMGHLDATGVTRRRGDHRIPGPRSGLVDRSSES
ncbi:MAG: selenocysteine-specific translation elongation factor [Acidimicrobiia bacterium]|nr:selenocysteine-specific translation elongation factor [Acidimicrobiia bacterium]